MRLVVDREIRGADTVFAPFGDVTLVDGRTLERAALREADVLLVRSVTRVGAALLDSTPVRFVGTATAGTDHLDMPYLEANGVATFSAPGCNARAVAEYVLACSLLESPRAESLSADCRVGIIGYGNVGQQVAALFGALGVGCVINDPPLAARAAAPDVPFASLEEALACDIVTLHVPLTSAGDFPTRHLVGQRELERLHPDALLVNAARGGVIDEAALRRKLDERPQAIVLDCWENEPLVDLDLLARTRLATPHIAGHTIEARERAAAMLARELADRLGAGSLAGPTAPHAETLDCEFLRDGPSRALRRAVLACCDPRVATAGLRATRALGNRERRAAFDRLRREAAGRREFSHYRIASGGVQSDTVPSLRALGFDTD